MLRTYNIKKAWIKRASIFNDSIKGVMLAAFPNSLNKNIHNWHLFICNKYFPKDKKKIDVLDIGCGYGRISLPLSKMHPQAFFCGIDVVEKYVKIFNQNLNKRGKAIESDIRNLDIFAKKFDYILIITVLIYLQPDEIRMFVKKLKSLTKKNTKIVIIENNKNGIAFFNALNIIGLLKKIVGVKNNYYIPTNSFSEKDIKIYFEKHFSYVGKERCSLLTIMLPILYLLSKLDLLKKPFYINKDLSFLPSLYEAYIFKSK